MTQAWNPNATGLIGLEWQPTVDSATVVDSDSRSVAQRLVSKSAETIANLRLYLDSVVGSTRRYLVDVYAGTEVWTGAGGACTLYVPNSSANNTAWSIAGPGGAATVQAAIDDATGTCSAVVTEDVTQPTGWNAIVAGFGATVDLEFNTGAAPLADRISDITVGITGSLEAVLQVYLVDVAGAQTYLLGELSGGIGSGYRQYSIDIGELNPDTSEPWTPAELRTFDTGGFRLRIVRKAGTYGTCSVNALWLAVSTLPETRVARAIVAPSAAGPTTFPVKAINTGTGVHSGNWSKANSVTHTYVLRRAFQPGLPAGGSVSWAYLESTDALPVGVGSGGEGLVGLVAGVIASPIPTTVGRGYAITVVTSAPTDSDDSQPFHSTGSRVASEEIRAGGAAFQQEISGAAATTYGILRTMVAAYAGPDATPGANLVVNLRRRSDNVLMGTWTLTPAQYADLPVVGTLGYRLWQVRAAATFVLAGATQYYLEYTSTSVAGSGWLGLRLLSDGATATYQGTTDVATVNGSDVTSSDFAATVSTVPTAPAGFAVTEDSQPTGVLAAKCSVDAIPFAALDWTSTALGGTFDYYEVQRSDDGGTTWSTIATISTEASSAFDDYEHLYSTEVQYRVRVVRTDGAFSDWSAVDSITIEAGACALFLTSNTDPALNVAYADVYDRRPVRKEYGFPDADEVVVRRVYGRDGFVVFRPTERRGERFRRMLRVNGLADPGGSEVAVFAGIRDLSNAALPYVVVRNQAGDRWFASVVVPNGTVQQPGHFYFAEVEVIPVAFAASQVDVS